MLAASLEKFSVVARLVMKRINLYLILLMITGLLAAALPGVDTGLIKTVQGQSTPDIELEQILSGLSSPVFITSARDDTDRLFIIEQQGRVLVMPRTRGIPTEFLNVIPDVLSGGERGLLGLAFHPKFKENGRFFVNYTRRPDGATVIAERHVSPGNPNQADSKEVILLVIEQPFSNHNGGMIAFGPDGFLYIGMGDGGSANDPGNRAQNVEDLLGKMLRIDVDTPNGAVPYSSPPGNPFFGPTRGRDEIFAFGLRNPWRFSFDRATGQLFAADVGQNAIEEIDIITNGGNYGWRVFEGTNCTNNDPQRCPTLNHVAPIAQYNHSSGRCSITGGYVYRGTEGTLPLGAYVYGDLCTGEIFMLDAGRQVLLRDTGLTISSFGEDEAGEIYVVGIGGSIHKLTASTPVPPPALVVNSAIIRHNVKNQILNPVTVKKNGKKYDIVVRGTGFQEGAQVVINGRVLKTRTGATPGQEVIAKLRNNTLQQPGTLTVEVVNPDGSRSNQLTIQVIAASAVVNQ
jgi:glucose/arabinose dehydrogenase